MKSEEFCDLLWSPIVNTFDTYAYPSHQIVLAHAAYESGWGESKPFKRAKNLFNITRLFGDPNPVIQSPDLEYDNDGTVRRILQRFAAYDSYEAALHHYKRFICRKRYLPAPTCLADGDLPGFVSALRNGGYFTLPLADYLAGISGVLDTVRKYT